VEEELHPDVRRARPPAAWHSDFGVTNKTVQHYLDVLTSSLVVQPLRPWYANIKKRQVKSPRVYILDTGILHGLLDIRDTFPLHKKVTAVAAHVLLAEVPEP